MKLLNAFSLSMVEYPATVRVSDLGSVVDVLRDKSPEGFDLISCVGHAETAALFSRLLNEEVAVNRVSVKLARGETALVGQYAGPRLAEGATSLPEGATIRWLLVMVE